MTYVLVGGIVLAGMLLVCFGYRRPVRAGSSREPDVRHEVDQWRRQVNGERAHGASCRCPLCLNGHIRNKGGRRRVA